MLEKKYQWAVSKLLVKCPKLFHLIFPYRKIIKYIISGGVATVSHLFSLYFFTEILGIWYVISSIIASAIGITVSFFFQKFWTFRDKSIERIKSQAFFYVITMLISMALNAGGIFILVHYFGINYLIAQIITLAIVAFVSFFVYGRLIFKKNNE